MKKLFGAVMLAPLALTACQASTDKTESRTVYGYVDGAYARATVIQKSGMINSVHLDKTLNDDYGVTFKIIDKKADLLDIAKTDSAAAVKNGFTKEGYSTYSISVNTERTETDGKMTFVNDDKSFKNICVVSSPAAFVDLTGNDDVVGIGIEGEDIGAGNKLDSKACTDANGIWRASNKPFTVISNSWKMADDKFAGLNKWDSTTANFALNDADADAKKTAHYHVSTEIKNAPNAYMTQTSGLDLDDFAAIQKFFMGKKYDEVMGKTFTKADIDGSELDSTGDWAKLILKAADLSFKVS